MRYTLIILLLAFGFCEAFAQKTNTCMVHLDKSFYVSGETIWYSLYLPAHMNETKVTLKVVVLDGNNKLQGYYFLASEGETQIPAYYKLPYDAPTGMYQILIWARTLNSVQESIFAAISVPVYNDLSPLPDDVLLQDPLNLEASGIPKVWSTQYKLHISVNPEVKPGGEQEVWISVKDENQLPVPDAQISVTVSDYTLTGPAILPQANVQRAYPVPQARWENRIFLRGTFVPAIDTIDLTSLTLGGYLPAAQRMYYSRVDRNGQFVLQFPGFYESTPIPFVSFPERDFSLRLNDVLKAPNPPKLVFTEGIKNYLQLSRQRKTLYQLFSTVEHPLKTQQAKKSFEVPEPDRFIETSKYEYFPDLATFFAEVVTPLRFVYDEKEDRYSARMYNLTNRTFYSGSPLFIIDDQLSRDGNWVARLDPGQIESVGIFHDFERLFNQFMFLARNGLVIIRTKSGKKRLPNEGGVPQLQGLQLPAVFGTDPKPAHTPNVRPQVFWSAGQSTDHTGTIVYRFRQTDDRSQFRVHVVAQTPNGERLQREVFYNTKGE